MKPLSNLQKSVLCQIARLAFDKLTASNMIIGISLDTWRRGEVERAVGLPGLRACGNDDYRPLCSHFESLAGEDGRALNHLLAAGTDKKRQIEHLIVAALAGANLPITYAEKIARDKFKRGVMDCDERQLRFVLITIKARSTSHRRKSNPRPSDGRGQGEGAVSHDSQATTHN